MVKRKELDEQISQEHDSVESSSGESSSDDVRESSTKSRYMNI